MTSSRNAASAPFFGVIIQQYLGRPCLITSLLKTRRGIKSDKNLATNLRVVCTGVVAKATSPQKWCSVEEWRSLAIAVFVDI